MARENYIGIDPGKKGFTCIYNGYGYEHYPLFTTQKSNQINTEIVERLRELVKQDTICVIESVHAMPGQGVTSMFSFGKSAGFIEGVLQAYGIPYQLITPQKWKKEFYLGHSKEDSITVCKRLFPSVKLLPTDRCKKESDGMAEALLMAEYARRHF